MCRLERQDEAQRGIVLTIPEAQKTVLLGRVERRLGVCAKEVVSGLTECPMGFSRIVPELVCRRWR